MEIIHLLLREEFRLFLPAWFVLYMYAEKIIVSFNTSSRVE